MRNFVWALAIGAVLGLGSPARASERTDFLNHLDKSLSAASARDGLYSESTASLHMLWSMTPEQRESLYDSYVVICNQLLASTSKLSMSEWYIEFAKVTRRRDDMSNAQKEKAYAFHRHGVIAAHAIICPGVPWSKPEPVPPKKETPKVGFNPLAPGVSPLAIDGRFVLKPK